MGRAVQIAAVLAGVFLALVAPAQAEKRVALVIGNSAYQNVARLPNPVNDAAAVTAAFEKTGFAVHKESDLDYSHMRRALRDFARVAQGSDVASANRSNGRGLLRVEPAVGTLVSYAAREGTIAEDGSNGHSPYSAALLSLIDQPGLEVNFLFRKMRDKVLASTGGQQEPFTYGSIPGRQLYLIPPVAAPTPKPVVKAPSVDESAFEVSCWESIRNETNASFFEAYLKKYPKGQFADLARLKLAATATGRCQLSSWVFNIVASSGHLSGGTRFLGDADQTALGSRLKGQAPAGRA